MNVKAWKTVTVVTFTGDEGDHTETHGWVDPWWAHCEPMDSRNDARPVAQWNEGDDDDREDYPTVAEFIRATVADELGSAEDNGDGTWYGTDDHMCDVTLRDGTSRTFALHFTTKGYDSRGWYEADVHSDGTVGAHRY
jgi:hypothetical protein